MTTNPANEREAEYRFLCIRALGCDCTDDNHARLCHRANDLARNEHYVGELEASIAETLPPLSARDLADPQSAPTRRPLTIGQVWTDDDLAAFASLPGVFTIGFDE